MEKETMMKILDNPTSYNSDERLTAARLAITFLDLLSVGDTILKTKTNQPLERTPKAAPFS